MFDMISTTSTGAILATALATPSAEDPTQNQFFAKDVYDLYVETAPLVFKSVGMN